MKLPKQVEIKNTDHGFKVVDSHNDDNQLATLMEFDRTHSDLSEVYARHFAEHLIKLHNNGN